MTTFRSEDLLIGVVALAAAPYLAWMLWRGFQGGRMPLGRGHVERAGRPAAFAVLAALYAVAAIAVAYVGFDLLSGARRAG